MNRGQERAGTIWAEQIDGGKEVSFQTPTSEFAAVARRDAIQHAFLEPLYLWASSVRHFYFGSSLGKENLVVFTEKGLGFPEFDERDPNRVVAVFRKGQKDFGEEVVKAVLKDMEQVGYDLEKVEPQPPVSIRLGPMLGQPMGLSVKEKDLPGITDQHRCLKACFEHYLFWYILIIQNDTEIHVHHCRRY